MPPSHLPEHKIGVFVRFASSIFATAAPASNKPHLAEKISGLASTLAYLGQMWLPPDRGAAAGWQMVLPDCAARKNLPLRCAGETAAAPETAARKWMPQRWDCGTEEAELRWRLWAGAAAKKPLQRERHREDARSHYREAARHHLEDARSQHGKPHSTIGKMRGDTIGKQEITYAVRRMRRPLMPM